jgi:hypothetical protein
MYHFLPVGGGIEKKYKGVIIYIDVFDKFKK